MVIKVGDGGHINRMLRWAQVRYVGCLGNCQEINPSVSKDPVDPLLLFKYADVTTGLYRPIIHTTYHNCLVSYNTYKSFRKSSDRKSNTYKTTCGRTALLCTSRYGPSPYSSVSACMESDH